MTSVIDQSCSETEVRRSVPGFLLTPFGWAAEPLATMALTEPALFAHLFEVGRARMHVIALALAHRDGQTPPHFGRFVAQASLPDILDRVLGRRPKGMKRAIAHLPDMVLRPENYRRLVELLDDAASARLLYHIDDIDDATIKLLYEVPGPLRRIVMAVMGGWCHRLAGFADGLRYLTSRGAAPTFDALVADLATLNSPGQFIARIKQLVGGLPLPEHMPPCQIGNAQRLDHAEEIIALAKRWRNCLAIFAHRVDDGTCAVYLWKHADTSTVCLIQRHGRFGWCVEDINGPQNAELTPDQLRPIHAAFNAAGVPQSSLICALENICDADVPVTGRQGPRRRHGNRQAAFVPGDWPTPECVR